MAPFSSDSTWPKVIQRRLSTGTMRLTASGLAVKGWVPVDQTNLRTGFSHVYAVGDVCTGPRTVPKAGIFAESAALVVAIELGLLLWIRDGLLLNIIMLVHPIDAVRTWQAGH